VVGCWHGYLSGVRGRFAYGPADATGTHYLLHGSETWPVRKQNEVALKRAETRMVR